VVNPYQGWRNGTICPTSMQKASGSEFTKSINCKTSIITIAPNGDIYQCGHLVYIKSKLMYTKY